MVNRGKSCIIFCCVAVLLALYNNGAEAQFIPFSLGDSDNDCYVQCPMECPQLNLDMVDCVVYCKMKCACPADDTECAAKAKDKMQKAADERESAIGPDEEEAAAASPAEYDITEAGASDSDAAFAPEEPAADEESAAGDLEDGSEMALSPDAMTPDIDTTSFVIEMDVSPTSSAGAPSDAPATSPQSASGAAAFTPAGVAAPTPTPTPQNAASPAPTTQNAASRAPQNAPSSAPQKAALGPNAPAPV